MKMMMFSIDCRLKLPVRIQSCKTNRLHAKGAQDIYGIGDWRTCMATVRLWLKGCNHVSSSSDRPSTPQDW